MFVLMINSNNGIKLIAFPFNNTLIVLSYHSSLCVWIISLSLSHAWSPIYRLVSRFFYLIQPNKGKQWFRLFSLFFFSISAWAISQWNGKREKFWLEKNESFLENETILFSTERSTFFWTERKLCIVKREKYFRIN